MADNNLYLRSITDKGDTANNLRLRLDASKSAIIVAAGTGAFTLTGVAAGLRTDRRLSAAVGTFALTGPSVSLNKGYALPALAASFTLTGIAAGLLAARVLPAAAATFTLTGTDAALKAGRVMPAGAAAYTLTGNSADLVYATAGAFSMPAGVGSFVLTGQDAVLISSAVPAPVAQPAVGGGIPSRRRRGRLEPRFVEEPPQPLRIHRRMMVDPGRFRLTGYPVQFQRGETLQRIRNRQTLAMLMLS